jgi:hypothetical protein
MSVTIFISAVTDEFGTLSAQLGEKLTKWNVAVKTQKEFKDAGGGTLEELDEYIEHCDAVVHLVGDMTGAEAPPESAEVFLTKYPDLRKKFKPLGKALDDHVPISYTQWEAWLAIHHKKHLFIALANEKAPREPSYYKLSVDSRKTQQEQQKEHLARLRDFDFWGCTFTTPGDLSEYLSTTYIVDLLAEEEAHDLLVKEQSTINQFFGSRVPKILGHSVMAALGGFVTWLLAGPVVALEPAPATLLSILGAIAFLAISLRYDRYLDILGAGGDPEGSLKRNIYVDLRTSLESESGGHAWKIYKKSLTKFLDRVYQFFEDEKKVDENGKETDVEKMAAHSLFPHAFGLDKARALWTPRSFDRCLFLSFVYPIATIFFIWAIAGYVGPAEEALGLEKNVPGRSRSFLAAAAIFVGFILWSFFRREERNSPFWGNFVVAMNVNATAIVAALIALGTVAGALTITAFGSVGAGAVAFGVAVAGAVASVGRVAGAVTVAATVPIALGLAFGLAGKPGGTVAVIVATAAICTLGILLFCAFAIKHQAQGVFLLVFIPAAIIACLAAVKFLSPLGTWRHTGPLLLFQGLLTLVNAPFNWGSIGVTRGLLRRGLERKKWWPFFYAIVDVIAATIIVVVLALAMVVAVQAFEEVVAHYSGKQVMKLAPLLEGIANNPAATEYWWIYALLLATMIPSLINLMIGGASLCSGIPGLATWLHTHMPEDKAVDPFDRRWVAAVLTFQTFLGALLGAGMGACLVVVLSVYVMPIAGPNLLDLARDVANENLPARVGQYFAGVR